MAASVYQKLPKITAEIVSGAVLSTNQCNGILTAKAVLTPTARPAGMNHQADRSRRTSSQPPSTASSVPTIECPCSFECAVT